MIIIDRRELIVFASLLVTAVLTAGWSFEADAAKHNESLELEEGERKIDQRVYTAKESRTYKIKSDLPVWVGFRTDFSDDMISTIQSHKNIFGREISTAAELSAVEPVTYAGSNHGGAVQAIPTNGIIEVVMRNYCRSPLKVLLYTEALTDEELQTFKSDGAF